MVARFVTFCGGNCQLFCQPTRGKGYIMIDAKVLSRSFTYNGVKLPDPDPRMTPEEVKTIYSHQYPELATAAITGPEASGEHLQYCFLRAIGTKG
jgi:PRTRC genetic system protein C